MFIRLLNRTQITILKYYIYTIKKFSVPKAVYTNKGIETVLLATT